MTALLLALFLGCAPDVGAGHVRAAPVGEAARATPATGVLLTIDPAQSSIGALGAKITATHPIRFPAFEGTVRMDGDTPTAIAFTVDMRALESDNPRLTRHLLGEDFFATDRFPTASFTSTAIVPAPAPGQTHTVEGDLEIRGVTRAIRFPATLGAGDGAVTARAEFVIDRQVFGVSYPGRADDLVQDDVVLTIAWTAPRPVRS